MNPPDLSITSPPYWRIGAQLMRGGRYVALAAVGLLTAAVIYAGIFAILDRASGAYVAGLASEAAWGAAFIVPMAVILRRMERTFLRYEAACSR